MSNIIRSVLFSAVALCLAACSSSQPAEPASPAAEAAVEINPYDQICDLIAQGKYSDAADQASALIESDGENVDNLTLRGVALAKLNKPYYAFDDLIKATKINRNVVTLMNIGNALRMFGYCDRATDAYRQALSLDPGNPQIYINLTSAYICLADVDTADETIQKSFSQFPKDPVALTNVSILKGIQGDYTESRKAAEIAIGQDAGYRPAYKVLAVACNALGDSACYESAKKQHDMLTGQKFRSQRVSRSKRK